MSNVKRKFDLLVGYLLLIIISIFCLYPIVWIVLSSFRTGTSLYSARVIPTQFTIAHYVTLFEKFPFATWYGNTLKIAILSMIFSTIFTLITAYIFSKFRFVGRNATMHGMLILGLFPGFMSMIAIYILLSQLNLLNTHMAIILTTVAGAPLGFLFSKNFFDTLPSSVMEAARIDGAGHVTIFARIVLPLARPLIVYTSLLSFAGAFTDFIFAQLVLRTPDKQTLAVGLYNMINDRFGNAFTVFAAGSVLIAVPITLLFIFMQRHLIEGLTAGADK
ncbi:sugar ABC transporter permease [Niallia sp. 03133]|uniref:sugar ABC transporter permease n=1 Tax=Niallia sp. 03133 TaxID=3458060 RepID=UPI004043F219